MLRKLLIACGIASSVLYVVMNIVAAVRYPGYNSFSQTVSELSAIGAPTRALWLPLALLYEALIIAFGVGVWWSAGRARLLQVVGALLVVYGVFGLAWPPMHQRAVLAAGGGTLTDTFHLVWASVTVLIMFLFIGFGGAAFGKRFRIYSIGSIVVLLMFGALTGLDGPRVATNLPTPWVGVWERISIAGSLLWIVVLAISLWRVQGPSAPRPPRNRVVTPRQRQKVGR